jgi:AcrR family transcriptional regulator
MDRRSRMLAEARRLTLEQGAIPSLNAVAAAAEVSKGGLVHHFPSRAALVEGLAGAALEEVDEAMRAAAALGKAAETWLRISVPGGDDVQLFRALAIAHYAVESPGDPVAASAREAVRRWEEMIARELGDAGRAHVVRLVGDGLAANLIAGIEPAPTPERLEMLIATLGIATQTEGR